MVEDFRMSLNRDGWISLFDFPPTTPTRAWVGNNSTVSVSRSVSGTTGDRQPRKHIPER